MLNKLTNTDYSSILKYYNIPITSGMSREKIKTIAEDILASKLCRCIKKVQKSSRFKKESSAIALCKKNVISRKNIKIYNFTCKKGKPRFIPKKNTSIKLTKIRKK